MPLFLAIDAGGTKTDFALAGPTEIIARARTESIKTLHVDAGTARERLEAGLTLIQAQSGVNLSQVAVTCVGAAGSQIPSVHAWLTVEIKRSVEGKLILVEDVEIALDAAFGVGKGVLVLAGTGSNVAGRCSDGNLVVHGGWGPALADYASGHTLCQTALRKAFIALDEGHTSLFLTRVLQKCNSNEMANLVEQANRASGTWFAELSPLLSECAALGDKISLRAIETETSILARLARVAVTEVFGPLRPERNPRIAFAGSIMEHFNVVRESVENNIRRLVPDATFSPNIVSPIEGALFRARAAFDLNCQHDDLATQASLRSTAAL